MSESWRQKSCVVVLSEVFVGCCENDAADPPQGGPLSPLLSNILQDDLDKELEKRGHQFCRYADDLIILVKSRRAGERVMQSISLFLEKVLKVQVNRDKSKVGSAESSVFLSFTFHLKRPTVSRKSFTNFKAELKRLTGRSWGGSMKRRYEELRTYLQGWMNYFGIGMRYNDAVELDHRLRRRIRMCYPETLHSWLTPERNAP